MCFLNKWSSQRYTLMLCSHVRKYNIDYSFDLRRWKSFITLIYGHLKQVLNLMQMDQQWNKWSKYTFQKLGWQISTSFKMSSCAICKDKLITRKISVKNYRNYNILKQSSQSSSHVHVKTKLQKKTSVPPPEIAYKPYINPPIFFIP